MKMNADRLYHLVKFVSTSQVCQVFTYVFQNNSKVRNDLNSRGKHLAENSENMIVVSLIDILTTEIHK